jgi:hypothetical protein
VIRTFLAFFKFIGGKRDRTFVLTFSFEGFYIVIFTFIASSLRSTVGAIGISARSADSVDVDFSTFTLVVTNFVFFFPVEALEAFITRVGTLTDSTVLRTALTFATFDITEGSFVTWINTVEVI